jgi:hypothetical protein
VGALKENLLSLGLRKHEKTLEKAINFRGDEVGIVDRGDENAVELVHCSSDR